MREILFRGKTQQHTRWIYGDLNHYMCDDGVFIAENGHSMHRVFKETVGQYTGLEDKNGVKIFEGDIVKTQPFYDKPYSSKRKSKQFIGVVEYKIRTFKGNSFYEKQDYQVEWGLKFYEDFEKCTHFSWGELWNCEVIGNIHDNPELLKGE